MDQNRCLILENGVPELSGITGTGCMVGALSAAFLAQRDPFVAALLGTSVMGIAGEIAAKRSTWTGKFSDGTSGCGGRADTGRTGGKDPDSGDWNIKWS